MTTANENSPGKPEGVITSPPATCSAFPVKVGVLKRFRVWAKRALCEMDNHVGQDFEFVSDRDDGDENRRCLGCGMMVIIVRRDKRKPYSVAKHETPNMKVCIDYVAYHRSLGLC